ncbi:MAG TPA: hypothetical protein VMG38_00265 [Trebonia sp.]|nr:hypothetical protein [Trebonia sp.]
MTAAPAASRRRALAAAGGILPRRPRVAAAALIIAGFLALAGCASGSGGGAAATANVFTTSHQVSLGQVNAEVAALYSAHPALSSFDVQDVAYTAKSRQSVLRDCTTAGPAAGSQDAETGQIVACAPLIFYFYSYGRQASVPAATTLAGDLYWYAVDHVAGPVSVQASLNELLQGWKLPVPGLSKAQQRTVVASSVLTAADDTMLTYRGVHMVITDRLAGSTKAQQITADMGTVTGTEHIDYGAATATIRVTRQAAYFTGSQAGLASYVGLPASAAAKAAGRWVVIKAGTSEYQDLAAENTLSALPSSVLPAASQVSQVRTATVGGQKVYVLNWTTTPSGSATPISVRLTLTATPKVLPVSETLTTKGESKTVTFSNWGAAFTVAVPAQSVPYAQVKG